MVVGPPQHWFPKILHSLPFHTLCRVNHLSLYCHVFHGDKTLPGLTARGQQLETCDSARIYLVYHRQGAAAWDLWLNWPLPHLPEEEVTFAEPVYSEGPPVSCSLFPVFFLLSLSLSKTPAVPGEGRPADKADPDYAMNWTKFIGSDTVGPRNRQACDRQQVHKEANLPVANHTIKVDIWADR